MTAKALTITVSGKRNIGDKGNDMVASLYNKNGRDVEKTFEWTFPDGSVVTLNQAVHQCYKYRSWRFHWCSSA